MEDLIVVDHKTSVHISNLGDERVAKAYLTYKAWFWVEHLESKCFNYAFFLLEEHLYIIHVLCKCPAFLQKLCAVYHVYVAILLKVSFLF